MKIKNAIGFTLVELMIGFAIVGIVAAVAAPKLRGLIKNYRLNNAARVIWLDLHKAKMLAIKGGRTGVIKQKSMRVDFTATSYKIVRVYEDNTEAVAFSRNLSRDYSIITFDTIDTAASVSFGSTGTTNGGTVVIQASTGNKCFTIALTGRIGTILVFNSTSKQCV